MKSIKKEKRHAEITNTAHRFKEKLTINILTDFAINCKR